MKGYLVMEEINWDMIIGRSEWALEEAISYIKGHEPDYAYFCMEGYPTDAKHAARVYIAPNYINSRTAKIYVQKNHSEIYDGLYCSSNTDAQQDTYSKIMVSPREFLEWCEQEKIPTPKSHLCKYLDYYHWAWKDDWTFDEAYLILNSEKCPLPCEVFEVLEDEETYKKAKDFYNLTNGKSDYEFGLWAPDKGDYLLIAKEEGMKLPKALELAIAIEKSKKERRYKEREEKREVDFGKWLNMPLWEVHEGLMLACNKNPVLLTQTQETSFEMASADFDHLAELFYRSHALQPFSFVIEPVENLLEGSLPPTSFISWLKSTNIDLPDEIRNFVPASGTNGSLQELGYTTPYLHLMICAIKEFSISDENQPLKKHLEEWLLKQEIDGYKCTPKEADKLASFVRMPASKAGGNRKST